MKLSRRRFLSIGAAALGAGALPHSLEAGRGGAAWHGRALGADVSISLSGGKAESEAALSAARDTLVRLEAEFSLYQEHSAISKLNREGGLVMSGEFASLMDLTAEANKLSDGLFDPTIQPLWQALFARGEAAGSKVGFHLLRRRGNTLRFSWPGMAISLNGIAQGFITDRISEQLHALGFRDRLVNIGEYRVGEGPAALGIADKDGRLLGTETLTNASVATSSPSALALPGGGGHILHPKLGPIASPWRTVSVIAQKAAFADAFSTALCLRRGLGLGRRLKAEGHVSKVILEDMGGQVIKI